MITCHMPMHKGYRFLTGACTCQPPQIPALGFGTWRVSPRVAQAVAGRAAAAGDAHGVMLFTTFVVAALWPMVPDRVPTAPPVQDAQMHRPELG